MNFERGVKILGIESSCDETAAAVVEDGRKILSDVVYSQIPVHRIYGGVVPEIASRNHVEAVDTVVEKALCDAKVKIGDIDAVAVTYGAGLQGALLVGVSYAKGLAQAAKLPLIGVNHIEGHVCANYLTYPELQPPYVCLIASGGHTAVTVVESYTKYRVVLTTVDDACGEAFDKVARTLGLPYPGGPEVDKLALSGKPVYPFHEVLLADGNFSYSGLKTAVLNLVNRARQKNEEISYPNIAASFNKCAVDGLITALQRVLADEQLSVVAVAGGVGANSYLRSRLKNLEKDGYSVCLPDIRLCGDNAAMIASRGYFSFTEGDFEDFTLDARPTLKLKTDLITKKI